MSSVQQKFLKTIRKPALIEICKDNGLDETGKVKELRARILDFWVKTTGFQPPNYREFLNTSGPVDVKSPNPEQNLLDYFAKSSDEDEGSENDSAIATSNKSIGKGTTNNLPSLQIPQQHFATGSGTQNPVMVNQQFITDLTVALATAMQAVQTQQPTASSPKKKKKKAPFKERRSFRQEAKSRGLIYHGYDSEDVKDFLERIERLRRCYELEDDDMVEVFSEVLEANAYRFWKTALRDLTEWSEVKSQFTTAFWKYKSATKMKSEILQRTQIKGEKIDVFISVVQNMNTKLETAIPDNEIFTIIQDNLHPDYLDLIQGKRIYGLEHLRDICREGEKFLEKSSSYVPPPSELLQAERRADKRNKVTEGNASIKHAVSFDDRRDNSPHLAASTVSPNASPKRYSSSRSNRSKTPPRKTMSPNRGQVASANVERSRKERWESRNFSPNLTCYNCNEKGHSFYACEKSPTRFCYNCGTKGVLTRNCHCKNRSGHSRRTSSPSPRPWSRSSSRSPQKGN